MLIKDYLQKNEATDTIRCHTAMELTSSAGLICPNGHYGQPTLAVAAGQELVCPECGGAAGGRIVACGTPDDIRAEEESITGKYL